MVADDRTYRRRGPGLGLVFASIVAIVAVAVYALIPVGVTAVLVGLCLWRLPPQLFGVQREEAFGRAVTIGLVVIAGYVVTTAIVRYFVPVGEPLMFRDFGENPLSQRLYWIHQQFLLTWPQEILFYAKNVSDPRTLPVLLGEVPGMLVAGFLLQRTSANAFKGVGGYLLACGYSVLLLVALSWLGMILEMMVVPAVLGERFNLFGWM